MISSIFDFALMAHHFVSVTTPYGRRYLIQVVDWSPPRSIVVLAGGAANSNNSGVSDSTTATYDTSVWRICLRMLTIWSQRKAKPILQAR